VPIFQRIQLICALVVFANTANAAGTISNALSAAAAGRGGTNLAFSDNGVLLMDNPAGMQPLVDDTSAGWFVDIGGVLLLTDLSYSDPENPRTAAENSPSGMGHFMVARRIHEDVVFGLGAFAPAGFASEYELVGPASLPGHHTYKSFGALARVLPGVSVQLTENWSVGATLGVALSHTDIEGPYYLNSGALRGTPTLLDLRTTGAALSWSCGTQYQLTEQTTIGARYQSENRFKSAGTANVTIDGLGSSKYDVELDLTWARSAGVGMLHRINSQQRIGIDLLVEDWSSAHDNANLTFTDPSNPVFGIVAGPRIDEVFPLRWKDALVVAVGYEHDLGQHQTFRTGYRFQDNPIPALTTSTYLQATLEHHFSCGYGFSFNRWQIDTAYQFAFGSDVQSGASIYPGDDFSNARFRTQAHMIFMGASRQF